MHPFTGEGIYGGLPVQLNLTDTAEASGLTTTPTIDTSGSNRIVVAICAHRNVSVRTLSSITLDGVAGTIIHEASLDNGIAINYVASYWLQADLPSSNGSYDLVQNWSAADDTICGVWSLSNVDQNNPIIDSQLTTASQLNTGTFISAALAGVLNEFVLSGIAGVDDDGAFNSSNNFTHPSGYTEEYDRRSAIETQLGTGGAYIQEATSATPQNTWDVTTGTTVDSVGLTALALKAA